MVTPVASEGRRLVAIGNSDTGQTLVTEALGSHPDVDLKAFTLPADAAELQAWMQQDATQLSVAVVTLLPDSGTGWREAISSDCFVLHLQTSYLSAPDVATAQQLNRNDSAIRRFRGRHEYDSVDRCCLMQRLPTIVTALGCDSIQLTARAQEVAANTTDDAAIRQLENRRLLLNTSPYLSREAASKIDVEAAHEQPRQAVGSIPNVVGAVVITVNAAIAEPALGTILAPLPLGVNPANLIVIFDSFACLHHYIADGRYHDCLQDGRLKLWHVDEWQARLHETFSNDSRCALFSCRTVLSHCGDDTVADTVRQTLNGYQHRYVQIVEDARASATEYYASEEFTQRLRAIANGAMPRVMVEQACHTVATKQFSRNAAEALKAIGCETHIHPNCGCDGIDYIIANVIDVGKIRPDFLIRPPNNFGTPEDRSQREDWHRLPMLISLQDAQPHLIFPKYVAQQPLRPWDMAVLMHQRVYPEVIEAGVCPEQVLREYIPAEAPPYDTETFPRRGINDIGFVKTQSPHRKLLDRVAAEKKEPLSEEAIEAILFAEAEVKRGTSSGETVDLHALKALGDDHGFGDILLIMYHEELCAHFLTKLHESKFNLFLGGGNWDKVPGLAPYAAGHIDSRLRYMQQFLENKINLSINPWNEYHPRIFDGGRCGAFFMVYRVPESLRWQPLPPELVPGEHYEDFGSIEELEKKCRYYLDNPEKREQIGRNLREAVEQHYSYETVMQRIIDRYRSLITRMDSVTVAE